MVHSVKCEKEYYQLAVDNIKNFEVRYNDRDYQIGDILVLCELDEEERLTGRTYAFEIIYILKDCRFVKSGYVVLGIKDII